LVSIGVSAICGAGIVQAILVWRKTGNRLHLLHIPVDVFGAVAFGLLYLGLQQSFSITVGTKFYFFLSLVFPPLILWAEEFTHRMERISRTADFELGLPMPSDSHQVLGAVGQLVQEFAKPLVAVQGTNRINQTIADLASTERTLKHMRIESDGSFWVDPRIVPGFRLTNSIKDAFVLLIDFLVKESSRIAGRLERGDFEKMIRERANDVVSRHSGVLIKFGLIDRLAGGILSERISSGLMDFDLLTEGGYPKSSAILLCGPPSDERNLLLDSFIGTGLARGDSCLYVTSAQPPDNVKHQFGDLSKDLTIVDCYTNRIREVPAISVEGNVITTPVEISVVAVAISRVLDRQSERAKRAVLDILPTYLVFQKIEKIYLDLMDIIDDLRKAGYTAIFSLNPYYIKDEGAVSTLEELFDGVIHVERAADASGMTGEISIRIEKMGREPVSKPAFKIRKPGRHEWHGERRPAPTPGYVGEAPAVEA